MHLSIANRALLRGMLAGTVVLAATSACSRSDRADSGRDTTQTATAVTPSDTAGVAATQPTPADTVSPPSTPSRAAPAPTPQDSTPSGYRAMKPSKAARTDTVAVGDSAQGGKTGERLESTQATPQANEDTLTNQPESDRIRPPEDSSETVGAVTGDSAAAGAPEMARDTSTGLAQADTAAPVAQDTATVMATPDTATQVAADTTQVATDTVALHAEVDTAHADHAEVAVETPSDTAAIKAQADTSAVVGDSTEIGKTGDRIEPNQASAEANADTLAVESERVRPPEDSTEVLGDVTTDQNVAKAEETQKAQSDVSADSAAVAAAGVQSNANMATGADAVALVTREGQRCLVKDPAESREVNWDLAESPATMNPCGTGTMTLPRVQTEK